MAVLARGWSMLLKGLDEAERAPNALAAAEMLLIRMAYAADLPSPEDVIKTLGGMPVRRGAAGTRPPRLPTAAGVGAAQRQARGAGGARCGRARCGRARVGRARGGRRRARRGACRACRDGRRRERRLDSPPASLDDYGAFDAGAEAGAAEPEDGTPEYGDETIAVAAAPHFDDPRSFADVVAAAGRRRDARLKVHLEEHVSLVKFDAAGSIELNLSADAPPEIANELREKLNKWTGRRWMVAVVRAKGERPIGVVRREREAAEIEALKTHPLVASVLEQFPGTRIQSVKPIAAPQEDEEGDKAAG